MMAGLIGSLALPVLLPQVQPLLAALALMLGTSWILKKHWLDKLEG